MFTFASNQQPMDLSVIKFQLKFRKVVAIVIAWQILAILNTLYMFGYMNSLLSITIPYNLAQSLLYSFISASLGGFLFGGLELFYLKNAFRKRPFGGVMILKSLIYIVLLIIVYFVSISIYFKNELGDTVFSMKIYHNAFQFITQGYVLLEIAFWFLVIAGTFLYLEISDRFGPGGLAGVLKGRYHHPKKETRIFMFMDIKDSTLIAEQLGHRRYFNFLNDFFSDITDSIIFSRGEIYQYVGDEIVVSWTLNNGLKHANCLQCFFDIKNTMKKKQYQYQSRYGIIPSFKAGFNHGEIMAGEMGVVKRDLVFSGDVLNTGARIQEKCNVYEVDNLISRDLLKFIDIPEGYSIEKVDSVKLRGKKTKTELYTVKKTDG
ncbi:MAG: adenylate/guanylate cyclase domain-containing protein [Bacteroidota bacterium]